jgi:AcrR family transcriptional regulator
MNLKDQIINAGLTIAARKGLNATTRDDIAAAVPCAGGSVSYHLGDAKHLRRALVVEALRSRNLAVIGWAIAEKHPAVQGSPVLLDDVTRRDALRVHLGR